MSPKNGRSWFIHYAGSCDYEGPDWMKKVMEKEEESAVSRRRFLRVSQLRSYMDTQKRPYIQSLMAEKTWRLHRRHARSVTPRNDGWKRVLGNWRGCHCLLPDFMVKIYADLDVPWWFL